MPGLGDPLVREMRRLAAAHADWSGAPTTDPEELLATYDAPDEPDGPSRFTRRDLLKTGAVLGQRAVRGRAHVHPQPGLPERRGRERRARRPPGVEHVGVSKVWARGREARHERTWRWTDGGVVPASGCGDRGGGRRVHRLRGAERRLADAVRDPERTIPNPAQDITAVSGDRSWYWTAADPVGGARPPRRGRDQPAARGAGGSADAEGRRQRRRRGGRHRGDARGGRARERRHRRRHGGDLLLGEDHKLYGLNAAGWAPASATPAFYHQHGMNEVPAYGVFSVTVPGAVDGWSRFLNRFGTMSLADVLQPSIEDRSQGFGLTERIRGDWESYDGFYVDMLQAGPRVEQGVPAERERAAPVQHLQEPGSGEGVRADRREGSERVLRRSDRPSDRAPDERRAAPTGSCRTSASFRSQWVDPITTNYKGYDVYEMPPQTQGFATLEMLNILEQCAAPVGYDLRALGPRSAEVLERPGPGEAAGLRRPAEVQRRSAVRGRPGEQADLEVVRGFAVRPDQPYTTPPPLPAGSVEDGRVGVDHRP